jgi:hypothetical protein
VLAIIAEHSFYLWDQAPSDNDASLISAINIYESSTKHKNVVDAVDKLFKGHLFDEAKHSPNPQESTFAKHLAQIAFDNRLCMSHVLCISL